MQEISILDVGPFYIGHATDERAATGCTVALFEEEGARCGVDVRGGGPASREHALLHPTAAAEVVNAILLSGGSAFGLDAAGGVMRYLNERNIGFDTGFGCVPIVPASCVFDLSIGSADVFPDAAMGYAACEDAQARAIGKGSFPFEGNVGVGMGCTVGKLAGPTRAMKAGFATYAVELGALKMGALVAVNALGDIVDYDTGRLLAGLLDAKGERVISSEDMLFALTEKRCASMSADTDASHKTSAGWNQGQETATSSEVVEGAPFSSTSNTTIGIIFTNASFDKTQLTKIAGMAHDAFGRTIHPVHTNFDGDSIYAVSVGALPADVSAAGALAVYVMGKAISRAAFAAAGSHGYRSLRDL